MKDDQKTESPGASSLVDEMESAQIDEARLLRKIDLRVLPMLVLIYIAAFLDRINISAALTMRLPEDLHLTGQQPNIALTIFFVPYIIFEIPSNIMMKRLRPHLWLPICIFSFGIIVIAQGFVKNYSGIIATRFFLGLAESGIFPGSFYLISFWYKPDEIQKRFTIYISSVILSSAFGSLLASAIANMDGVRGLANWRWIFILEGIATVLIGCMAFFLVTDFPQEATWLTEEERKFVSARTKSHETEKLSLTFNDFISFFKDINHHLGAIMYFLAYFADKAGRRLPFVLFGNAVLLTGLIMLRVTPHRDFSLQYTGICLTLMGAMGAQVTAVCWYLMNLRGHKMRAMGSGYMVAFGNLGGIIGPFAFLSKYAPGYKTGYTICLAMAALGIVSAGIYALLIVRQRKIKRGANGSTDEGDLPSL
ncbi:putative allantoate permease [Lophiostoma macrostomum CBS 122681]|uniref:Putative allantoate permease n=1 Tax=Lophiostoma macrostomum CBS 122681 TaxID=1314788 RepID=A0A6A6TES3_9PLEO|nr:putative allantoate permease [Lophiostoma macrostomum CBS 122681]